MLIYEALEKDHLKITSLIDELLEAGEKNESRRAKLLLGEIRDELIPHSRAEEAVFYNVLASLEHNSAEPLILHRGYHEHIEAESLLRTLIGKDVIDSEWKMLARRFQKITEEHVQEEEEEIFATAKHLLSDLESEMMARTFEELKPLVQKEGWVKDTLDLVVQIVPPKYAATLRTIALRPEQLIKPLL